MNQLIGWLNIYKPVGISSFNVVNKIKKKYGFEKIGHTGTLDPLAEGILPIALGKTTKLIYIINNKLKSYEFTVKWGEQTSTDDREGKIIQTSSLIPQIKIIKQQLKNFVGNILQKPPKASSVKINGKRAYKRFRNNEFFETKEKIVNIYKLEFLDQLEKNISKIKVVCGTGLYVRSLARDLAESLNTKGHVHSLKRTRVGKFNEKNSILLDDLLKISQMTSGIRGFHSSISMLDDIPALKIDNDEILSDISHGRKVKINLFINHNHSLIQNESNIYLAVNKDLVVSIGKIDGIYFHPHKVLI